MEEYLPVSLGELRRKGVRLAEVGRLTIIAPELKKGRIAELMLGYTVIPLLYLKNIDVLFSDALSTVVKQYIKLGFKVFPKAFLDKETMQKSYLCWFSTPNCTREVVMGLKKERELLGFLVRIYFVRVFVRRLLKKLKIRHNEFMNFDDNVLKYIQFDENKPVREE